MKWQERCAKEVRPGDVVADPGGEEHEVTEVEKTPTGEVVLKAGPDYEQLALIVWPDQSVDVKPTKRRPAPQLHEAITPSGRTDFQRLSTVQGRVFEDQACLSLEHAGFEVTRRRFRVAELGIEVDAEAKGSCGVLWFQFKGS